MKNLSILILLLIGSLLSCTPVVENTEDGATANVTEKPPISNEEKAINQAVLDAYASISFEEGTKPDIANIRAVFTPQATFGNFVNDTLEYNNMEEFLEGYEAAIGQMKAFKEMELGGKTEYFGKIAHRISSYGFLIDDAEEIGQRGVNSFQLFKIDGKWKVNSIIWDIEKEGQSIPDQYLSDL